MLFAGAQLQSLALVLCGAPVKYEGMLKYGLLADRYTQLFEKKWVALAEGRQADESVLGTGDIQSLADLGNSFELVRKMRVFPVEPSDFVALAIPALVPVLPLLKTDGRLCPKF